ncbi:hypothetical protein D9757_000344 [Collybiopsis confluens]|uniref:DUF1772-domain-containing protein n=1 Tax=Collybiopsis confluens TaxID=2823264 RepID=A0A8H5I1W8_9AGAR|nr:hypothetical protein D9757_000344 [Collybiopsis confluens]
MSVIAGLPIGVRIAAALGLAGSAWCSGACLSCSFIAGASLTDPLPPAAAAHASRMWQNVYNRGGRMIPPAAITSSLAFAYASVFTLKTSSPSPSLLAEAAIHRVRKLFGISSALMISVIPFWLIIVLPTVNAITAKAKALQARDEQGKASVLDDETLELIKKWNWLNGVKGIIALAVTSVGVSAILF